VSRHTAGSLIVAASALSWGVIGVIVREVSMPALTIVAFRVLLSAISVAAILIALRRWDLLRPPRWPVLALGALLAVHWGLYFAAIKQTSVASAVLVTYAGPIVIAMLAPLIIMMLVIGLYPRPFFVAMAQAVEFTGADTLRGTRREFEAISARLSRSDRLSDHGPKSGAVPIEEGGTL